MILSDDFRHILSGTLAPPTQVGVWIPKAKQGPTADFFRPLGMPDTLDRLQDGTAAAILFRVTRHSFHPAQTLLNSFREPQRAVLEVQEALEGSTPSFALFADLSRTSKCAWDTSHPSHPSMYPVGSPTRALSTLW